MKLFKPSTIFCITACAVLVVSSCSKNNTPPGSPGTGGFNILYPATMSSYDGTNSAYPIVTKYQYDEKSLLKRWGTDSAYREVAANGVNLVVFFYPYRTVTGYAYKMYNQLDTSVNIYTGAPTELNIDFFSKNVVYGYTQSNHLDYILRENNANGLLLKEITSAGGGKNINYSYDDKKNLKTIEWVELTGPRTLTPYSRLTIIGLDDKPSPFVAVQGYKIASYPQSYPVDFAWAYCNNNPRQIKVDSYDAASNTMKPYEQDDFTYTYNANGYPTTIVVQITYFTATTSHYTKTYNFTYK